MNDVVAGGQMKDDLGKASITVQRLDYMLPPQTGSQGLDIDLKYTVLSHRQNAPDVYNPFKEGSFRRDPGRPVRHPSISSWSARNLTPPVRGVIDGQDRGEPFGAKLKKTHCLAMKAERPLGTAPPL